MTLRRDDALRALVPHVKDDDIVVAVLSKLLRLACLVPAPAELCRRRSNGAGFVPTGSGSPWPIPNGK